MSALPPLPGFSNPVDNAQAVFRALLTAFSHPGLPVSITLPPFSIPAGKFSSGMLALALALCDKDTPLWLDAAADTPETRRHLRFHCGAPFTAEPAEASFAFISRPEGMPRLREFNPGLAEYPDRSATLVISAELPPSQTPALELTGPGVKGNNLGVWQPAHVSGLPTWFWEDWAANSAAYPLGVDVVFADKNARGPVIRLLGLPRTSRVRLEEFPCM
ncbi:MAG: phosphonate C-P lyase system protein PhnH [Deltaproteobacteria bacterium]|jgi:alpha-D-ribose 1-methylphosphonate 5-triphosphate synthase subunit PhnH|nr:phosphonate C-P lyase system protein PhnH [Deltaproteobacteria bacterium]